MKRLTAATDSGTDKRRKQQQPSLSGPAASTRSSTSAAAGTASTATASVTSDTLVFLSPSFSAVVLHNADILGLVACFLCFRGPSAGVRRFLPCNDVDLYASEYDGENYYRHGGWLMGCWDAAPSGSHAPPSASTWTLACHSRTRQPASCTRSVDLPASRGCQCWGTKRLELLRCISPRQRPASPLAGRQLCLTLWLSARGADAEHGCSSCDWTTCCLMSCGRGSVGLLGHASATPTICRYRAVERTDSGRGGSATSQP